MGGKWKLTQFHSSDLKPDVTGAQAVISKYHQAFVDSDGEAARACLADSYVRTINRAGLEGDPSRWVGTVADAGMIDEDGYVWIMARTDDVINVAGHRLSTGAMEEVLASHPDVAECAVIGVSDPLKGQLPVGFMCLTKGVNRPHEDIVKESVGLVRDQIGPVAAFKLAVIVDRLPKTRSGKILRATMVKLADGEEFKMPATIDDPAILDEIKDALQTIGYAK